MKKFELLLCFLLCILPCIFTLRGEPTSTEELEMIAKSLGMTRQGLQECLAKVNSDWDTMMELSDLTLGDRNSQTKDVIRKVGCFGACIYKKNGMMVNSKIMPARVIDLTSKLSRRPEEFAIIRNAIEECGKRVFDTTDECDITLAFSHCIVDEASRQSL